MNNSCHVGSMGRHPDPRMRSELTLREAFPAIKAVRKTDVSQTRKFSREMVFYPKHDRDSDVIEVVQCSECRAIFDICVVRISSGFFSITGKTEQGIAWMTRHVPDSDKGQAFCDDSRYAYDIFTAKTASRPERK
jgi:hypothetical protein